MSRDPQKYIGRLLAVGKAFSLRKDEASDKAAASHHILQLEVQMRVR